MQALNATLNELKQTPPLISFNAKSSSAERKSGRGRFAKLSPPRSAAETPLTPGAKFRRAMAKSVAQSLAGSPAVGKNNPELGLLHGSMGMMLQHAVSVDFCQQVDTVLCTIALNEYTLIGVHARVLGHGGDCNHDPTIGCS